MRSAPRNPRSAPSGSVAQVIAAARAAFARGDIRGGVASYRKATELSPRDPSLWMALGNALVRAGEFSPAVDSLRRACDLAPADARFRLALADAFYTGGAVAAALPEYLKAAELEPTNVTAWANAGAIFHQLGKPHEALMALQRALAIDGKHAMTLNNAGLALFDLGEFGTARQFFEQAVVAKSDYGSALWNRAILDLLHGDYVRGWEGHEYRHVQLGRTGGLRSFPEPRWKGERFDGKRLLVWPEQGLGDQLQFVRFIPRVKALGGTVVLMCASPLRDLFTALVPDADEIVVTDTPYAKCDLQVPLMSLPFVLGLGCELDGGKVPYISTVGECAPAIDGMLPLASRMKRVGVVWAGQPKHQNDRNRSISLETISTLFDDTNVEWFSVQKGDAAEQALEALNSSRVVHGIAPIASLGSKFDNFIDTTHALSRLDLVITVDTAVAHLAGAMNIPTFVLLPYAPDWRWQLGREDTPWYPSVRLFRQTERGNWHEVIDRVREAVRAIAPVRLNAA